MDKSGLGDWKPRWSGNGTTTTERRATARPTAEDVPGLRVRLSDGIDVRLIDVSHGGVRFECDRQLLPGSIVALRFALTDGDMIVRGRVLRERLTRLASGAPGYEIALAFVRPFTELRFEDYARPATEQHLPDDANATHEVSADPNHEDVVSLPGQITEGPSGQQAPGGHAGRKDQVDEGAEDVPEVLLFVANVGLSSHELWQVFNGNDW